MSKIKNGTIAEMMVCAQALKSGFTVFTCLDHNSTIDLIIVNKNKNLFKIQVKKAFVKDDGFYIETRRRTDSKPEKYKCSDFDYCIACEIMSNNFWLIPIDVFLGYKSAIKLDSKKVKQFNRNWDQLR